MNYEFSTLFNKFFFLIKNFFFKIPCSKKKIINILVNIFFILFNHYFFTRHKFIYFIRCSINKKINYSFINIAIIKHSSSFSSSAIPTIVLFLLLILFKKKINFVFDLRVVLSNLLYVENLFRPNLSSVLI